MLSCLKIPCWHRRQGEEELSNPLSRDRDSWVFTSFPSYDSGESQCRKKIKHFIRQFFIEIMLWPIGTTAIYFVAFFDKGHISSKEVTIIESVGLGILPSLGVCILRKMKRVLSISS